MMITGTANHIMQGIRLMVFQRKGRVKIKQKDFFVLHPFFSENVGLF